MTCSKSVILSEAKDLLDAGSILRRFAPQDDSAQLGKPLCDHLGDIHYRHL
jgi:hypothetical protein